MKITTSSLRSTRIITRYKEQQGHNDAVNEMINLRSDLDDCMAFISSIPKNLREQLYEKYDYLRELEQERVMEMEM